MSAHKMTPLTKLEQMFAEENLRLVFKFMSQNHLPGDEWFDVVVFGYLKAIRAFHAVKKLQQFSFSTVAFQEMRSAVAHEKSYWRAKRRPDNIQSLDATLTEDQEHPLTLLSVTEDHRQNIFEKTENTERIHRIFALLDTKRDCTKKVFTLRLTGYSYREIAEGCHISIPAAIQIVYDFRRELRKKGI